MLQTTINNAITIPEDEGTGLDPNDADWISAGHIGGLLAQDNLTNHVEHGFGFTVDYPNQELSIDGGLAYVRNDDRVMVQDARGNYSRNWDEGIGFAVATRGADNIDLYEEAINDVYLVVDPSVNNGCSIVVVDQQEANEIEDPSLKIGEVNTLTNEATETNREPTLSAEALSGSVTNDKILRDLEGDGIIIDADGRLSGQFTAKDLAVHSHSSDEDGGAEIAPTAITGDMVGDTTLQSLVGTDFEIVDGELRLDDSALPSTGMIEHGDEYHSVTYTKKSTTDSLSDEIDALITEVNNFEEFVTHGDAWHTKQYITADDLPDEMGMSVHGDEYHSKSYATESYVDTTVSESSLGSGSSHTFRVPTDFATVSDAFDHIDTMYKVQGRRITIVIEEDHELQTYVSKSYSDYRNVRVESEDDVVYLADSFPDRHVFQFQDYCIAPEFAILIDGEGHEYTGFNILFHSSIHFDRFANAGARNCDVGLTCNQSSSAYGDGLDFSGAGYRGCMVNNNSKAQLHNSNFDGAAVYGLRVSMSRVDCIESSMQNCGEQGLRLNQGAVVQARGCNASGSGGHGVSVSMGGKLLAQNIIVHDCVNNGINIDASEVYLRNEDLANNGGWNTSTSGNSTIRG